ncbi:MULTISPECIES: hypothetical protein [unclassified Kosakonia]|uniref:hypothetical protein n=1 Tax=unclassified Kosakonia TaxID=2632876 RepID=UPI0031B6AC96
MIDEKQAIEAAKAYALKKFKNCWDYNFHLAELVEIEGAQYWQISTNHAPSPDAPFHELFLPTPVQYYVDPETGKCVGFKNHRSKCIQNPGG